MFFGLTNSPATFQALMNSIFADLIAEGKVAVYLDDILIFTESLSEHRQVVHDVLTRLNQHDFYLQPEKCDFERSSIEYLGLVIGEGEVRMDPVKWTLLKIGQHQPRYVIFEAFWDLLTSTGDLLKVLQGRHDP